MMQDIRYALRMIRRAPLLSAAVILTVALAIAANTAIFSVVNAVLLKPLPFAEPDRIVQVAEKNDKLKLPSFGSSLLNFVSWREQAQSFTDLAAVGFSSFTLTGSGEPEQFSGSTISPSLMRVLGLSPILGRAFYDNEEKPGAAAVAMISEGVWRRRFGSDPSIIGRSVDLNGIPTTIVGIAPASLNLISGGDIYTPQTVNVATEKRLNHQIITFGRLRPGVSFAQAQAEMNAVSVRVGQQYPEVRDWGIRLISLFDTFVPSDLKRGLLVLLFAVGFVLLIACANIANLLLARASVRQNELAVRTAIGAPRTMLVRQLLVESVVLSVLGGTIGLLGAFVAVRAINRALPPNLLPVPSVQMDLTVLWFAVALTMLTGLLFGLAPALRTSRVNINEILKQGSRSASGAMGGAFRNVLAGGELALATVLLIGAALLIQTFANLEHAKLGYNSHGAITFQLAPPVSKYPLKDKAPQFYRELIDSLQSLPGVSAAAVSTGIPFGQGSYTSHPMLAVGQTVLPPETLVPIDWRCVSPGYFQTMNIPLLRGRDFTSADGSAAPVTIVSQATAKKFWGDADPLGRSLARSADRATKFTVVGVVGDVRSTVLNQE
ncbi:MAG: ABC transporter permease, partial [Acidobacteria bacterium]|nr:ABC transporter permease [Acidobacteriota bacterium]